MPDKPARALALLAEQRAGLEQSIAYWSQEDDAYSRQRVREARRELAKVAAHESDMARDAAFFAPLVLGFQGDNGRAALVRSLCADTPVEREEAA